MYCSYCESNKHTLKNCPETWGGSANRMRMYCSFCNSRKHNINACPETWGGSAKREWNEKEIEDDYIED